LSTKATIWLFVSLFWVSYWYMTLTDIEDVAVVCSPLLLGWAIWLIRR
jgi:hypothetical protein